MKRNIHLIMKVRRHQRTRCSFLFMEKILKTCCTNQFFSAFHLCAAYDAFVPPTTDVKATIVISTRFGRICHTWDLPFDYYQERHKHTGREPWWTLRTFAQLCIWLTRTCCAPAFFQQRRRQKDCKTGEHIPSYLRSDKLIAYRFFAEMHQVVTVFTSFFGSYVTFSFVLWTFRKEWCITSTVRPTKITLSLANKFSKCCHRFWLGAHNQCCKSGMRYWQ